MIPHICSKRLCREGKKKEDAEFFDTCDHHRLKKKKAVDFIFFPADDKKKILLRRATRVEVLRASRMCRMSPLMKFNDDHYSLELLIQVQYSSIKEFGHSNGSLAVDGRYRCTRCLWQVLFEIISTQRRIFSKYSMSRIKCNPE